ncbi:MAG: hypothetical protein NZ554_09470, partial [Bryobacteraceae bacterium]|nr:hypothetical protein [Bryobacteraceae bacterium]
MSVTNVPKPFSRRELLGGGLAAAAIGRAAAQGEEIRVDAGVDRVTVMPGKTYLRGWVGHGHAPSTTRPHNGLRVTVSRAIEPSSVRWRKVSGPGDVRFENPAALATAATFSRPGEYVLGLDAEWKGGKGTATLHVTVEPPPPWPPLEAAEVKDFRLSSAFW